MPRPSKGPRLYFRRARRDARSGRRLPDLWVIRDGEVERSTGCSGDGLSVPEGAEQALTAYLAEKYAAPTREPADRRRDPAQVLVAEVLALYSAERCPDLETDPATNGGFVTKLIEFWGGRSLADVRRSTCQEYLAWRIEQPNANFKDAATAPRVSEATAARELDALGGAIAWWHGEDTLTSRPKIWTPDAAESPREALTRPQAAALLWAAMGHRKAKDGPWRALSRSGRANRLHMRRFILCGLYTGTRHNVLRTLLWEESAVQPWTDLDAGMIYRRGRRQRETANKRTPVVKMPPRLLVHMRRWRALDHAEEARRSSPTYDYRWREAPGFQIVSVLHHAGKPFEGKIRRAFASCVKDAGLPPEVTPHWLRHTAATWLMESGVEPWQASAYLGMTTKTLEEHYGHHRPDYQAAASRAIAGRK